MGIFKEIGDILKKDGFLTLATVVSTRGMGILWEL